MSGPHYEGFPLASAEIFQSDERKSLIMPDRTAEAVKPWLATHPDIQVVSRDRASTFADAVSQVLPHATQIADRYHLVQNLREHLQRLLDHKRSCLPLVEDTAVTSSQMSAKEQADSPADLAVGANADAASGLLPSEQQGGPTCAEAGLSCLTYAERKKKISRDKRVSPYEEVVVLHREGLGYRAIARRLRISRHTVQRYVSSPGFPERAEGSGLRAKGASKLDPYLLYGRKSVRKKDGSVVAFLVFFRYSFPVDKHISL